MENKENTLNKPIYANCDQEDWIKSRIRTAINMAIALKDNRKVAADDPLYISGVDGIINGAAWEIIRTLGMEPEGTNVKNPYHINSTIGIPISKQEADINKPHWK
jgi:hypothetical protein